MNTFGKTILSIVLLILSALSITAQQTYVVQNGETIEEIAVRNNLTVDDILTLNPNAANFCFDGLQLTLPDAESLITSSASGFGTLPTSETIRDHYRRSSICLILLVHTDKPYADAMLRVFQNFPMPVRYNEHNIDLRVVEVDGKQKKSDIERILRKNNVGQKVVSRWFNRDNSGLMNLDLIHDRGGYGAFHDDYQRTLHTVRGTATLRDEGVELLENTFVLVCDMEYAEQNKGFKIGSILAGAGSIVMGAMATYNMYQSVQAQSQGDYKGAAQKRAASDLFNTGSKIAATGAAALADLSKFRVNIHSYLYKLNWDQSRTATMFNTYWVDETTPSGERTRRTESFNNAHFGLDYVGDYAKASSKTKLVSCTDVDQVVLDVCDRSVSETVKALAQKFVVFRPRTPFYCENGMIYSYIGTKEDVAPNKKYEIVKRSKAKNGKIEYKRIGVAKAQSPWQNTSISFDRYFNPEMKGTAFYLTNGRFDEIAQTPGLQIREMK